MRVIVNGVREEARDENKGAIVAFYDTRRCARHRRVVIDESWFDDSISRREVQRGVIVSAEFPSRGITSLRARALDNNTILSLTE